MQGSKNKVKIQGKPLKIKQASATLSGRGVMDKKEKKDHKALRNQRKRRDTYED